MFAKKIYFYYNNLKRNIKFLITLLFGICLIPILCVCKWFCEIPVFFAVVNVRIHFVGRYPKIRRTFLDSSPLTRPISTSIWFIVATNKELKNAKQSGYEDEIIEVTKKMLARYRYPKRAMPKVHIGIVSQEAIDTAGGYLEYFS